jgi:hypothetical protein
MNRMENIHDSSGKKIAEVHHNHGRDSYYDSRGHYLGKTDRDGTRGPSGRLLADKPVGGLLIPRKP